MKCALIGIASVGILAVTVEVDTANAQSYRRYDPARTYTSPAYTPQSRGSVRREGVLRTTPFADPNLVTTGTERTARSPAGRMRLADRLPPMPISTLEDQLVHCLRGLCSTTARISSEIMLMCSTSSMYL
jgi:hypothetical protein